MLAFSLPTNIIIIIIIIFKWVSCHCYSRCPYPHALKPRQGPQGPEGSQCPQGFDGGKLRVAQSIGYKADQGHLSEDNDRDKQGER